MISFGYLTKESAEKRGVEVRWKPSGPESVWVEISIDTGGELKVFAEPQRGNHIDLEISRGEKKPPLLRALLREDRSEPGRVKVSFSVLRSELHNLSIWLVQALPGTADVVRMEDFIALDEIDLPAKEPSRKPGEKNGEAPAAATPPAAEPADCRCR